MKDHPSLDKGTTKRTKEKDADMSANEWMVDE
jgi:hypothetical protein